jgi:F5/8 type C domain-containing protein
VKKLAVVAAVFLALSCARGARPHPVASKPAPPTPPNLLELAKGAAVVSRTGEALLGSSAVRAIDGDRDSIWANPPDDQKQTLVFSLPSRARLDRIGLTTSSKRPTEVRLAQFAVSEDGLQFNDVGTFPFEAKSGPQLFPVRESRARFVRVTTLAGEPTSYLQINAVHAIGSLIEPLQRKSMAGCWTINGDPAFFVQSGSLVRGYVGGALDTYLEGGFDGRFFRFAWIRGRDPEYGLAAIGITPDAAHLSGIVWHEEAIQAAKFLAEDWLGEKCGGGGQAPPPIQDVFQKYLERFGYAPLYGLRFDDGGRLDEAESAAMLDAIAALITPKSRFVAHELLGNPAASQTKLDTLRAALQKRGVNLTGVDFAAMGNRDPRRPASIDLTRAMYNTVEMQIRR